MRISKIFKKIIKPVLLFCPIVCIPIVSVACKTITPKYCSVGTEWTIGEKDYKSTLKFDSFDYKVIDSNLEIKASITIIPSKHGYELFIDENDKFLSFIQFYEVEILPNRDKSIEQSGFDVFQKKIWDKSICIYVYDIPLPMINELKKENDFFITQDNPNIFFEIYMDGLHYLFFEINGFDIIGNQSTNN
ncbi:MAG: hypothetical protein K2H56_03535 [Malacoplasma sp.]|nr:hypothetical protein [Malacoplasma sp.]